MIKVLMSFINKTVDIQICNFVRTVLISSLTGFNPLFLTFSGFTFSRDLYFTKNKQLPFIFIDTLVLTVKPENDHTYNKKTIR